MGVLQTTQQVTGLVAQLGGLAILAGTLAAVAAIVHRWYVREIVPRGLALLVGLAGVAIYLNTTTALGTVIADSTNATAGGSTIAGNTEPTETQVALFNIAAFLVGAGGATVGRHVGDRFASDVLGGGLSEVEEDVGRLVQSVGRVVAVELPADIDDVVGYDPVATETKEELAGKRFLFPRGLTVGELRERLVSRLKADYGVGHVDVELADDGSVEYIALGSRAAGIGPTLPPATNAVAVRADPAFAASAGDLVQVWETDPMRRVLTAELRGVADDTVTIAIDAADTQKVDPNREYRLVTLPVQDRPDREFASLLRAAEETFSSVAVEAGSPLHGMPVGALNLAVVALEPEEGTVRTLPEPSTVLAPGDVVFAIARPDVLRRLEAAAKPLDPGVVSGPPPQQRRRQGQQPPPQRSEQRPTDETATRGETEDQSDRESGTGETTADGQSDAEATATETAESSPEDGDEATGRAESDSAETDPDPRGADDDESGEPAGRAGASSFQELKEDFESGEADWADDDAADEEVPAGDDESEAVDAEVAFGDDEDASDDTSPNEAEDDGLDALDIAEDEPGGDEGDGLMGDDSLDDLSFDDEETDDDLASLSFDEEAGDEGLSLDDEGETESEDGEDSESDGEGGNDEDEDDSNGGDDEEDDEDEDDSSGGGASSFQQLKEEFESGEADWEDDISDSPGGDMRLDE